MLLDPVSRIPRLKLMMLAFKYMSELNIIITWSIHIFYCRASNHGVMFPNDAQMSFQWIVFQPVARALAWSTIFDIFLKFSGKHWKLHFLSLFLDLVWSSRDCSQLKISLKGGKYAMLRIAWEFNFIQTPTVKWVLYSGGMERKHRVWKQGDPIKSVAIFV